jgi:predicted Zn-ribbon and HTH transcriptional regulator
MNTSFEAPKIALATRGLKRPCKILVIVLKIGKGSTGAHEQARERHRADGRDRAASSAASAAVMGGPKGPRRPLTREAGVPSKTRRQAIVELLQVEEWSFDDLRRELGLTVAVLEEDLHHIQKSVRAGGQRLEIRGACCDVCGFRFSTTALHPPGRCPGCRQRRIDGPWLRIRS